VNQCLLYGGECRKRSEVVARAVVAAMIPFLICLAALLKIEFSDSFFERGRTAERTMLLAGVSGFTTTVLGIRPAFFRPTAIKSLLSYEIWMSGTCFIGLADIFLFYYGKQGRAEETGCGAGALIWEGSYVEHAKTGRRAYQNLHQWPCASECFREMFPSRS